MSVFIVAICSNPDCTRHAAPDARGSLPGTCPTCGAPMLDRCWKCAIALTDPFSSYCGSCGVPLKRVLPRAPKRAPVLVLCGSPDCDWAAEIVSTAALPSRCPVCRTPVVSHCWKCGAHVIDLAQLYCQACGVPLKRQPRPA